MITRRHALLAGAAALPFLPSASVAKPFGIRDLESVLFQSVDAAYQAQINRYRPYPNPRYEPPSDLEQLAFYWSARSLLSRHFDAVGWPSKVPEVVAFPPDKYVQDYADVLGGSGIIACRYGPHNSDWWRQTAKGEWQLSVVAETARVIA